MKFSTARLCPSANKLNHHIATRGRIIQHVKVALKDWIYKKSVFEGNYAFHKVLIEKRHSESFVCMACRERC